LRSAVLKDWVVLIVEAQLDKASVARAKKREGVRGEWRGLRADPSRETNLG